MGLTGLTGQLDLHRYGSRTKKVSLIKGRQGRPVFLLPQLCFRTRHVYRAATRVTSKVVTPDVILSVIEPSRVIERDGKQACETDIRR